MEEMLVVVDLTIVDEVPDDGCSVSSRRVSVDGEILSAKDEGRCGWRGEWRGLKRLASSRTS